MNKINENEWNLKFTEEVSWEKVNFLDLEVFIVNNTIATHLYRKPTSGNALLHATSFHPRHLIESIPYREMVRAKHNFSSTSDAVACQEETIGRFKSRGYSESALRASQEKANTLTRENIHFNPKKKQEKGMVRLITTYSNQGQVIRTLMRKNYYTLHPVCNLILI